MAKPVLYVFSISHYCEKARWALDYLGIPYQLKITAPGVHIKTARKLGLKTGSLPILQVSDTAVQGSSAIIDWAEKQTKGDKTLAPTAGKADWEGMEKRLDDVAGIHVRRYYYSEALVDHPQTVRPLFTKDIPLLHGLIVRYKWDTVRHLMIKAMDLGSDQGAQSLALVSQELDWLDGMLAGDKRFLVGDALSRVDLTAASLLAPLVAPGNHPTYNGLVLPPRMTKEISAWLDRPSIKWVEALYRQYR